MHRLYGSRLVTWAVAMMMGVGVLMPAVSMACAVCWGKDDALSRGINVSIVFLMSMPFLIGASIFGVIYVAHKRAQGQRWSDRVTKPFPWR